LIAVLKGLLVPITLIGAHFAYLVALLTAESIISSPRIDTASLDANMLRMIANILGGALGFGIIAFDSQSLESEVAEPLSTEEGSSDQSSETDGPKTQ
jgi:hypothetical protein